MSDSSDGPGTLSPYEPFYEHRVPPYRCPKCTRAVLQLMRDTLNYGQTADSRWQWEVAGPEIGEGDWRFCCLFRCCDADCEETVACIGTMCWDRDPRLPHGVEPPQLWKPGLGPMPDIGEQMARMQAELVHRYQPMVFLPAVERCAPGTTRAPLSVADDFSWIVAGGVRYSFKPGNQAKIIRELYQAWKASGDRDGSGLSEETIGKRIGSSANRFRVQKSFEGAPALGTILRSTAKGQWALFLGSDLRDDSAVA